MHATVMVIRTKDSDLGVEDVMGLFDENREMEEPEIIETRDQLIKRTKGELDDIEKIHPEYTIEDYRKTYGNNFIDILLKHKVDKMTEQNYLDFIEDFDCLALDGYGNSVSYYNPDGRWDWWTVGGRWENSLPLKDGSKTDSATVGDIDWEQWKADGLYTYAVITEDNEWITLEDTWVTEEGGWFETKAGKEGADWKNDFYDVFIEHLPEDAEITIIDYHC